MTMPAHARALLDDLFAARDTIDTLIVGVERFYGVESVEVRQRAVTATLRPAENTPWVAPPAPLNGDGAAAPPASGRARVAEEARPGNRTEDILAAVKKGPRVGLSCADITRLVFPHARGEELKSLISKMWSTLQTMKKNGLLVEDSRLYTAAAESSAPQGGA